VNLWSRKIQSTQPLTIEAHSKDFGDPRILGDASPGDFVTAANPKRAIHLTAPGIASFDGHGQPGTELPRG